MVSRARRDCREWSRESAASVAISAASERCHCIGKWIDDMAVFGSVVGGADWASNANGVQSLSVEGSVADIRLWRKGHGLVFEWMSDGHEIVGRCHRNRRNGRDLSIVLVNRLIWLVDLGD